MQSLPQPLARRRNPERTEARRHQVLEAATRCFRQSGFRGASMAQISAAAGMSTGHIYHYFKNKEAIVEAIVAREREGILADIDAVMLQPNILQALAERAGEPEACGSDPDCSALRLEMMVEASRNPVVAAMVHEDDRILRERLRALLKRGQEQGSLLAEPDLDSLTALLTSIFIGMTARDAVYPQDDRPAILRLFKLLLERFLAP